MSLLVRPVFSYYNGYTGKGETETKEEKEPEAKELLEPKIVGTHTHTHSLIVIPLDTLTGLFIIGITLTCVLGRMPLYFYLVHDLMHSL